MKKEYIYSIYIRIPSFNIEKIRKEIYKYKYKYKKFANPTP